MFKLFNPIYNFYLIPFKRLLLLLETSTVTLWSSHFCSPFTLEHGSWNQPRNHVGVWWCVCVPPDHLVPVFKICLDMADVSVVFLCTRGCSETGYQNDWLSVADTTWTMISKSQIFWEGHRSQLHDSSHSHTSQKICIAARFWSENKVEVADSTGLQGRPNSKPTFLETLERHTSNIHKENAKVCKEKDWRVPLRLCKKAMNGITCFMEVYTLHHETTTGSIDLAAKSPI